MAKLPGKNDEEKLNALNAKIHKEQAVWFLNAFWKEHGEKDAGKIWDYKHKFDTLDPKKAEGNELDEMNAHRFLESISSTLTIKELRDLLRGTGIDKFKYVSLTHYLLAAYKVDWHRLVNAAQGDNEQELIKAQKMLDEMQVAFKDADASLKELDKSAKELKAQEDAYNNKTNDLKKKTEEGSSAVAQNKAKAELAAHMAEDPLPLRKAKITNDAALKKAEKACDLAKKKLDEAEAYLKEVSMRSGSAKGSCWWMDRELVEAKKYLPQKKGGVGK